MNITKKQTQRYREQTSRLGGGGNKNKERVKCGGEEETNGSGSGRYNRLLNCWRLQDRFKDILYNTRNTANIL